VEDSQAMLDVAEQFYDTQIYTKNQIHVTTSKYVVYIGCISKFI